MAKPDPPRKPNRWEIARTLSSLLAACGTAYLVYRQVR